MARLSKFQREQMVNSIKSMDHSLATGFVPSKTLELIDRLKERERVANVLREQASLDNICRGMDDD